MNADRRAAPVFSVITIFHNEQRFLADAVASVLAQSGPSWELILVDDGSTDGSGEIARARAAARPDRVRCIAHAHGENRGMSASRNLGIDHAAGEFITFLDADDVWLPGKLRDQLALLRSHPDIGVLVSPAEWWWSWDTTTDDRDRRQRLAAPHVSAADAAAAVVEPPELVLEFLADEWQSICDLVIRRDLMAEIGGYEPAFAGMFEDQVFHTKVLSQHRAVVTERHWYRYRQHSAACTATSHHGGRHIDARRRFLEWAVPYVRTIPRPSTISEGRWRAYLDQVRRQRLRARRDLVAHRLRRELGRPLRRRRAERPRR